MKTTKKIWLGVGAFVVAGTGSAPATGPTPSALRALERPATISELKSGTSLRPPQRDQVRQFAAAAGGEGGEGGQGGEGGEAGIDIQNAGSDPVEYNIALQVIAAHYYAGLAAYEGKEMEAGAQMFAHGLSEVYVEMEDVFKRRGVTELGKKLEAAVEAATAKSPPAQVRRRVQDVLKALAAAEKTAPKSSASAMAVRAQVVANLLDRTAAQYSVSIEDKALEPYLDGLGFAIAARREAAKVLPRLRRTDKRKAQAIGAALKLAGEAYPGIQRPNPVKVEAGRFLAAASSAKLAASGLK